MVKLDVNLRPVLLSDIREPYLDTSLRPKKMETFILNGNGELDINGKEAENTYGFRLQEINHNTEVISNRELCDDAATSLSSYSNSKHRIDAMFDDSRSVLSDFSRSDTQRKSSLKKLSDMRTNSNKEKVIANNIQEKIEKLFEEISISGLEGFNPGLSQTCQKNRLDINDFAVTYLGSKLLNDKNITLMGLQDPLKELYFEFRRKSFNDHMNILTISTEGLKIKVSDKEELHAFPSIAVWASVKLVFRVKSSTTEYAFLPLVTDPQGIDKNSLFKELKEEDKYMLSRNMQRKIEDDNQSPIFTVVMKNLNLNKQLECHGFICKSSEDAIVIAANLYQALMKKLKRKKEMKEQKNKKSDKKNAASENADSIDRIKLKVKENKPPPPIPGRLPNQRQEDPDIVSRSETFNRIHQNKNNFGNFSKKEVADVFERRRSAPEKILSTEVECSRPLRRTVSDRGAIGVTVNGQCDRGDILTKVAIPRSQSFLNANGPLSRFSRKQKTNSKNEILSPLGLKELFNEFKIHEGLESMDDILNVIIDAEGMSFNDLKPIYKEFLLKLAVTLTKDELYQRSKIIMRHQKKRNRKCHFRRKPILTTMGFNKIFRKTTSRLKKSKNSKSANLEFTSIIFQSNTKQFRKNLPNKSQPFGVNKRKSGRQKTSRKLDRLKNRNISTTSEDSDCFQSKRNMHDLAKAPNRSSSGYFSCSECSHSSEDCTCTSTDKCYCILGHKKDCSSFSSDQSHVFPVNSTNFHIANTLTSEQDTEDSLNYCSCDTESCADSGKCYCTSSQSKTVSNKILHSFKINGIDQSADLEQEKKLDKTICPKYIKASCRNPRKSTFNQLKKKDFDSSDTILSRADSPNSAWHDNEKMTRKGCLHKSESSEFILLQKNSQPSHFHINFHDNFLKEIQNTIHTKHDRPNAESGFQNNYYPDNELRKAVRKRNLHSTPSHPCERRYSSLRCRNELLPDFIQSKPIHRSVSYRTKHLFNSARSKHSCDNIMNHIKFPDTGFANTSLRFTSRMDVYNSFSENNSIDINNRLIQSAYKENRRKKISRQTHTSGDDCRVNFSGSSGNSQSLDYTLCQSPNFEKFDSTSHVGRKKILVVSARDPKGKVLYMGANTKRENDGRNLKNYTGDIATNATEALSVKKSAEIAALFSELPPKQNIMHVEIKDQKQNNLRTRSNPYRSTNLENDLGYLP